MLNKIGRARSLRNPIRTMQPNLRGSNQDDHQHNRKGTLNHTTNLNDIKVITSIEHRTRRMIKNNRNMKEAQQLDHSRYQAATMNSSGTNND